ncbi:MAG TPA: LbtU family siderophore porin [Nitrospirae bacterium]|nr:LbtU family siderophore porin [Nitrospirota bacterium]
MRKGFILAVIFTFFLLTGTSYASDVDSLMDLLLKKGIITQKEHKELKAEIREEVKKEGKKVTGEGSYATKRSDRISIGGAVAGEYRWVKHSNMTTKDSDSTSDLYLRTVELSLEAELADWITTAITVNSEWIGDDVTPGDEKLTVDEAAITLRKEGVPLYLIAGKRTQPFGVFESHLVTDPMTQDAYETKRTGVTLGYQRPFMDLDASVTVYKGEEMMTHLFESGLFDSDSISRVSDPAGYDVGSYILNVSITPIAEHLRLSAAYLSEPGNGKRNNTLSLSATYNCLFIDGLSIDAAYITALQREEYRDATVLADNYKERVLSLGAAYRVTEPVEVALRYEHFDDDGLAKETGAWSVENRYSIGGTYTFYENEDLCVSSYLALEYRKTDYRLSEAVKASMGDDNSELYMRLGMEF